MGWFALTPYALLAAFLLFVPGLILGTSLRLRGWGLASVAPVLSITLVSVAAIVADLIGLTWGILPVMGLTIAASAIAWALIFVAERVSKRLGSVETANASSDESSSPHSTRPFSSPDSDFKGNSRLTSALSPAIPFALAAGIATWQLPQMLTRPDAFSQTWDNIFHLSAVRWILDAGNGSSLTFSSLATEIPATFYPGAWHDVVSLVATVGGDNAVTYATNAVTWAIMAIVWPLGCLFLLKRVLPDAALPVRMTAGILASSFAAFPSLLVGFGVLYPNLLGFALLPLILGLCLDLLGLARSSSILPLICQILTLGACLPGLFLAHPNALLSLVALTSPLVLTWTRRKVKPLWADDKNWAWAHIGIALGIFVIFLVIWAFGRTTATYAPPNTTEASLGEVLLASPLVLRPFWLLGILFVIGIGAMLAKKTCMWLIGPLTVTVLLWWAVSAMHPSWLRNALTAGYYTDPYRLAALLPLGLLPICALGFDWLWTTTTAWIENHIQWNRPFAPSILAALGCLILLVGIQASPAMQQHLDWVAEHYAITPTSTLVDSDELAIIKQVPDIVDSGDRVATNPWNGSSMLYPLEGIGITTTSLFSLPESGSLATIIESLDEAGINPGAICPALRNLDVAYVLDFGDLYFTDGWAPHVEMPGFDQVASAPGFVPVAVSGHAVLYKITACD